MIRAVDEPIVLLDAGPSRFYGDRFVVIFFVIVRVIDVGEKDVLVALVYLVEIAVDLGDAMCVLVEDFVGDGAVLLEHLGDDLWQVRPFVEL